MKLIALLCCLCLLLFSSCKENTHPRMQKAEWLLGEWGYENDESISTETWRKVNDSVFYGKSFTLKGKDTVFSEELILNDVNGKMALTVSVPGQNDEKPVRFELTAITGDEMVFENPAHDFPTKIEYRQITADSLFAVIYGKDNGEDIEVPFPMKKRN